ncbi:hypothetical protein DPX16_8017 [Anabarilius grahami]|uniref:C-factor n=1 Tax=Anabarilius grahami TaxID=495550 RepID=A0A3N0Z3K0_ANAGA|nr:hypothetical protein DPX16_8017 [Anabarilius grahami]
MLALKEQQSTLDSVVASTVREAIDSVLTPALRDVHLDIQTTNDSVKELKAEGEKLFNAAKQTRDMVDSVQAAARKDRRTVSNLRNQLEQLTKKMTDIEDWSRRNNVRLVGLPEGAEGSDAAGFLRANLSKWIPSLWSRDIEIRAHCVYDGRKISDRLCTLIFRVLRLHDRSAILKGARQAYPVKYTQDNVTLLFFTDFSPATTTKRKSFNPVLKKMTLFGLQSFLIYAAAIKLRHKATATCLYGKAFHLTHAQNGRATWPSGVERRASVWCVRATLDPDAVDVSQPRSLLSSPLVRQRRLGANRGLGLELVKQLSEDSCQKRHIYATCRDPDGPNSEEYQPYLQTAAKTSGTPGMSCNKAAVINISTLGGSISSMPPLYTQFPNLPYAVSKAALNMLSVLAAEELKADEILCMALHPGWVKTEMGGEKAPLEPKESVEGMLRVIGSLTEKQHGGFMDYTGETVPW